jgi:hypothetical protein
MMGVLMMLLVFTSCTKNDSPLPAAQEENSKMLAAAESATMSVERKRTCLPAVCTQEKKRKRCLANRFVLVKLRKICDQLYGNTPFPDFERLRMDRANLREYAYVRLEIEGLPFYLPILRSLIPEDNQLPVLNAALAYCACDQPQEGDMLRFVKLGRYKLYWCNSCTDCEMTENDR